MGSVAPQLVFLGYGAAPTGNRPTRFQAQASIAGIRALSQRWRVLPSSRRKYVTHTA